MYTHYRKSPLKEDIITSPQRDKAASPEGVFILRGSTVQKPNKTFKLTQASQGQ